MKYHILAIFAVSLLLLFGCASKPAPVVVDEPNSTVVVPEPVKNTTAAVLPCSAGNIVQNDNCFSSLAWEKSNSTYCKSIYSVDTLDACLYHFANTSLEICKQVTNSELRFSCLTANAVAAKSEAICNMIDNTEAAAACLKKVLPPCMLISDESARSLCIALDKGDFSYCTDDACLEAYAFNKSSDLACGAITQQVERYYCLALVKKSTASCRDAPLSPIQDACIERSAEALDDLSGCGLATDGSDYRNNCYLYFAIKNSDPTICQKLLLETQRDLCYKNYSIGTATVDACPKVVESTNRVDCYFKAAKLNRKPSLCNPLWTTDFKNTCYSGAILYPANGPVPSDCPDVANSGWEDKCYYQAARATYNSTLCGLMSEGASDKRNCNALFNLN
ncbi:MAG: hypothetical protein WCY41_02285 [Candidatus Micrarchaeia archaeon]